MVFFAGSAWVTLGTGANGMDPKLAKIIRVGFFITLIGHAALAAYGAYLCRTLLKLSKRGTAAWYTAIFLSGLLAFQELQELLKVDRKCKSTKQAS